MANPHPDDSLGRPASDTVDPSDAPNRTPHSERHVPLRSPTGGTDWSENMRRSRPTNKGKGVPGQRRG